MSRMINTSIIIINYVTINNNFNNDNGSSRADMFAVSPELSDWVRIGLDHVDVDDIVEGFLSLLRVSRSCWGIWHCHQHCSHLAFYTT